MGSFAGAAISSPPVQLGMVALAVVAPQAAIVVGIRNRIDRRVRERVQSPRDTSDWRRAGEELEALRRGRAALPSPTQLRVLAARRPDRAGPGRRRHDAKLRHYGADAPSAWV
ncbi:MAG TPA: hypothetical protein VFY87_24155 [Geminicoccaceae bacterium]|nr:hypothetical protein [Geminicoccaceae bacterium]